MSVNPLSYQEVEAYERKALVHLSAWETDLLMRMDTAVLAVLAGNSRPAPKPTDPAEPIPAENSRGVAAFMRGFAVRKNADLAKRQAKAAAQQT